MGSLSYFIITLRNSKIEKNNIAGKIISGLVSAASFLSIFVIPVTKPTIYPLEDSVRVYEGIIEIEIKPNDSSPFIQTYYSLDGSDPEDGYIYEDSFIITTSTTVYAKNKFFGRWSEPSKSTYKFESIPITYSSELDLLISDKLPSARELLDFTIFIVFVAIIIWTLIRKAWRNICDRIRNFFDPWI